MKPTNANLVNRRNANLGVYGRAYIKTDDGYMFGGSYVRTLKEQTEAVDEIWDTLDTVQKNGMFEMYETYLSVVKNWELDNLKAAYEENQTNN